MIKLLVKRIFEKKLKFFFSIFEIRKLKIYDLLQDTGNKVEIRSLEVKNKIQVFSFEKFETIYDLVFASSTVSDDKGHIYIDDSHKFFEIFLEKNSTELRFISINSVYHPDNIAKDQIMGVLEFFKTVQNYTKIDFQKKIFFSLLMKNCKNSFHGKRFLYFFLDFFFGSMSDDERNGMMMFAQDVKKIRKTFLLKKRMKELKPKAVKKLEGLDGGRKEDNFDFGKCKFIKEKIENCINLDNDVDIDVPELTEMHLSATERLYLLNFVKSKIFEIHSKKLKKVQNKLDENLYAFSFDKIQGLVQRRSKILEKKAKILKHIEGVLTPITTRERLASKTSRNNSLTILEKSHKKKFRKRRQKTEPNENIISSRLSKRSSSMPYIDNNFLFSKKKIKNKKKKAPYFSISNLKSKLDSSIKTPRPKAISKNFFTLKNSKINYSEKKPRRRYFVSNEYNPLPLLSNKKGRVIFGESRRRLRFKKGKRNNSDGKRQGYMEGSRSDRKGNKSLRLSKKSIS